MQRREFLRLLAMAAAAGASLRASASDTQAAGELYDLPPFGNVSLLHMTDAHAQLLPIYYREPSMIRSPFSRALTRSLGSAAARARSAASASPAGISGLSAPPPCGLTSPGMRALSAGARPPGNCVVLIRR